MKEIYERTEMNITVFEQDDVITTSGAVSRFFKFSLDEYEGKVIEER